MTILAVTYLTILFVSHLRFDSPVYRQVSVTRTDLAFNLGEIPRATNTPEDGFCQSSPGRDPDGP